MRRLILAGTVFALLVAGGAARANEQEPLRSELEAYLVIVDGEGNEVVQPADATEPGSIVEYRLYLTNVSAAPIEGLAVNGPVPSRTTYLAETASADTSARLVVSIDGGQTFEPEPVIRQVHEPDGTVKQVVVSPSRYTHIRWLTEGTLEADATAIYKYRVRVDSL